MAFVGKYEVAEIDKESMDAYLKAIGVSEALRKIAKKAKSKVEITERNGEYTVRTLSSLKNMEFKFRFGEQFVDENAAFKKCTSRIVQEENKLIQDQIYIKDNEEVHLKITREFTETEMAVIFEGPENTLTTVYYVRMTEDMEK